MTSHPPAVVHFLDVLEHLHLTETNFVLHPQLISCKRACGIADKCLQTTFSPSVPYQQPIISVGLSCRSIVSCFA